MTFNYIEDVWFVLFIGHVCSMVLMDSNTSSCLRLLFAPCTAFWSLFTNTSLFICRWLSQMLDRAGQLQQESPPAVTPPSISSHGPSPTDRPALHSVTYWLLRMGVTLRDLSPDHPLAPSLQQAEEEAMQQESRQLGSADGASHEASGLTSSTGVGEAEPPTAQADATAGYQMRPPFREAVGRSRLVGGGEAAGISKAATSSGGVGGDEEEDVVFPAGDGLDAAVSSMEAGLLEEEAGDEEEY